MNESQNHVSLIGYLGEDPQDLGEGERAGTSFSLATSETFGQGEEKKERTDWHRIVCWNGVATSSRYLAKGDHVAVFGKLRSNDWQDAEGNHRRSIEVHAADILFLRVRAFAEPEPKKTPSRKGSSSRRRSAGRRNA